MQSNSLVTSVEVENETNETVVVSSEEQGSKESAISQKEKFAKKIETNKSIITFLAEKFPNCFSVEGDAKPLKLGIFQDIIEDETVASAFSKTNIRAALRYYTMSWRYLSSIKDNADRVNLQGEQAGTVDAKQVEHAQNQLAEAKLKVKARQDASRKQHQKKKPVTQTKPTPNGQAKTTDKFKPKNRPKAPSSKPISTAQAIKQAPKEAAQATVTKKIHTHKAVEIKTLTVGQEVNVLIGQAYTKAEIVEITKDNVRVSLPTGMTLTVKHEHLTE